MVALTPTYPLLPGYIPIGEIDFYISGSLVVFLIVMTVLGGVYLCGILVYLMINHFSTRCVKVALGQGRGTGWVLALRSHDSLERGKQSQVLKGRARNWIVRDYLGGRHIGLKDQKPGRRRDGRFRVSPASIISVGFHPVT